MDRGRVAASGGGVILPEHKRAVRLWVEGILADAGKPIPLARIVNGNADSQTTRPYAQLLWTGNTARGPAPERRTVGTPGNEERRAKTTGTGTVSVTIVGPVARESYDDEADAYATELAARVSDHDLGQPLRDANMSVAGPPSLQQGLDALTGQSQWETRAAVDVTFNTAVVVTSTPGIVHTAVVSGTTEPPAPIGTIEVSAP
jgi:hypothetical protein